MRIERFEDLKGETLSAIENCHNDELIFTIKGTGEKYSLFHQQECCEHVYIEDICGDLESLTDFPILMAEEVKHENKNPEGVKVPKYQESFVWTFYKLATVKGYVTIRFYGESDGYYSESVEWGLKQEAIGGERMTIKECYEKYKHLDICISDDEWGGDKWDLGILRDIWLAIKQHVESENGRKYDAEAQGRIDPEGNRSRP